MVQGSVVYVQAHITLSDVVKYIRLYITLSDVVKYIPATDM